MQIEFTGRHTEVPDAVKALAERKLLKLDKVLRGTTHAKVVLGSDRHRQSAEVTVHSAHLFLAATEVSTDMGASLAAAIQKITRQAERHEGRRRSEKRREPGRMASRSRETAAPVVREPSVKVFRTRGAFRKPMTVDEAVLEMEGRQEPPFVFRDAATDGVRILYRRKDGNLGLIEA